MKWVKPKCLIDLQEESDNFPLPAGDEQLFIKAASEFLRRRAGLMCTKPCVFLAVFLTCILIFKGARNIDLEELRQLLKRNYNTWNAKPPMTLLSMILLRYAIKLFGGKLCNWKKWVMQKRTLKRTKTNFGSDKSENELLPKRTLANKEAKIGLYKNESWLEIKAKSARWKAKIGGGGTVLFYCLEADAGWWILLRIVNRGWIRVERFLNRIGWKPACGGGGVCGK